MTVVEIESGTEHELPADTVTRDPQPPPHRIADLARHLEADQGERSRGPLVPLAFRPCHEVFFICTERWPELTGRPLRVKNGAHSVR